jgi:hypothetical protein
MELVQELRHERRRLEDKLLSGVSQVGGVAAVFGDPYTKWHVVVEDSCSLSSGMATGTGPARRCG